MNGEGIDLTPQLLEGKPSGNRELFWELSHEAALRSGTWKYLRTSDRNEYLFNVDDDPYEKSNLAEQEHDIFMRLKCRHARIAQECLSQ